jgi:hypothetical protein
MQRPDCESLPTNMTAEKAGNKVTTHEDVSVSMKRCKADTLGGDDHAMETGIGIIGLLFSHIVEVLRLILIDMESRPSIAKHHQSLESSSATLFFWGNDLGVSQGGLDKALQDSSELHDTCLLVLVSIGQLVAACKHFT